MAKKNTTAAASKKGDYTAKGKLRCAHVMSQGGEEQIVSFQTIKNGKTQISMQLFLGKDDPMYGHFEDGKEYPGEVLISDVPVSAEDPGEGN